MNVRRSGSSQEVPLSLTGLDRLPPAPRRRALAVVEWLGNLQALPQVVQRALACIQDSRSSSTELAAIIATDQAISARLLGMANSVYGRGVRPFVSVHEAVVRLGYRNVQNVLLSLSATRFLEEALPLYEVRPGELWQHSVATATGARVLAARRRLPQGSASYVAGLLHDAGRSALDRGLTAAEKSAIRGAVTYSRLGFQKAEYEVLGFSHAEVGAALLHRWGLSEEIVRAIARHHQPSLAPEDALSAITHGADVLALLALPIRRPGWLYAIEPTVASYLGLSADEHAIPEVLKEIEVGLQSAERLIGRG